MNRVALSVVAITGRAGSAEGSVELKAASGRGLVVAPGGELRLADLLARLHARDLVAAQERVAKSLTFGCE